MPASCCQNASIRVDEAKAPATLEAWLERVDALRAQVRGNPIPVDDLVAAVEGDRS